MPLLATTIFATTLLGGTFWADVTRERYLCLEWRPDWVLMSVATFIFFGMIIDCDSCTMRDIACSDCVVSILIGPPSSSLGSEEARVIDLLASRGMIPPLRYENAQDSQHPTRRSG